MPNRDLLPQRSNLFLYECRFIVYYLVKQEQIVLFLRTLAFKVAHIQKYFEIFFLYTKTNHFHLLFQKSNSMVEVAHILTKSNFLLLCLYHLLNNDPASYDSY